MGCLRIICLVLVVMIFSERSDADTYNVGDSTGWRIPPETSFYADWANKTVLRVGDKLFFNWTGTHDVAEVTEAEYENCTMVTSAITSPVNITLTDPGKNYYICTIDSHCKMGQKLEVEVTASNTTTNGTTPSAPPPSSASSFGPIGALCAATSFLVFSFLA